MDESQPTESEHLFLPVGPDSFISGEKLTYDIYLKMPGQRFVKICNKGAILEKERIKNYVAKGIEQFFIRKDAHEKYLKEIGDRSSAIVKAKVPFPIKVTQVLEHGDQLMIFVRDLGVGESELQAAV